jgi:hypothetical protein
MVLHHKWTGIKVFVLSVADGTNATVNALSAASSEITLSTAGGGGGRRNLHGDREQHPGNKHLWILEIRYKC